MKSITIIVSIAILKFSSNYANAGTRDAVYLHEGFNGTGLPTGWSNIRISGSQASWSVVGPGSNPTVPPYAGTGQAKFNSFDASVGEQARLTSRPINLITATDPFLSFFMYHENEYFSSFDSVYVEASTGDSVAGPWVTLRGVRRPRLVSGWTKEVISLYAYRGISRLFVSLRGVSKYGNNIFVDEFRIADSSFHDIGAVSLLPANIPTPETVQAPLTEMTSSRYGNLKVPKERVPQTIAEPVIATPFSTQLSIVAVIRNFGTFNEPTYQLAWRVDQQLQPAVAGHPLAGRTGLDTLAFAWQNPTTGLHTLTAWTVLASDSNRVNDTIRVIFQVLEAGTVFYESFNDGVFPPSGWSVINRDAGTLIPWFRGADTSAFIAFEGNGFAADNFQRSNGNYLDDYFITPSLPNVGQAGFSDSLVVWVRSAFNQPPAINFPDSLMVLLSTTGIDTSNFTVQLDYFAVPKTGWTRKGYLLTGRVPANSSVRVVFRYLLYGVGATTGSGDFIGLDAVQLIRGAPLAVDEETQTPNRFNLEQNYPNPFNPSTEIRYQTSDVSHVTLKVYDMLGREVAKLVDEVQRAGVRVVKFTSENISSGIYYYRLKAGSFSDVKKMLLIR